MHKQMKKLAFFLVLLAASAAAQTNVTTTGGTANTVPLFTGGSTIGNSLITQSNGGVGIGTTSPAALVHIQGVNSSVALTLRNGTNASPVQWCGGTYCTYELMTPANGNLYLGADINGSVNGLAVQPSGNVGIGTTTPGARLEVDGGNILLNSGLPYSLLSVRSSTVNDIFGVQIDNTAAGGTDWRVEQGRSAAGDFNISNCSSLCAQDVVVKPSGNVGIGTTSPAALVHIQGVNSSVALTLRNGTNASPVQWCGGTYCTYELMTPANGNLYLGADINGSVNGLAVQPSGNVGIGTTTPGARLEVNGNVKLTSGSGASITFADGTVQSTAFTGVGGTCGGDYAESVDVSGNRTSYEPGDVLVIDPGAPGKFLKANEAYSTLVAGIYSTKPGVIGRRQTTDSKTSTTEVPMAMVGIVPTKVSAENGPIKTGDLLVASSTLGRAMKGTDRSLLTGAVIGKALGTLDSGTGVIEVLVTLQ